MAQALATQAPASPNHAPSDYIEAGVRRMFAASGLSQIRFVGYDHSYDHLGMLIECWTCPREKDLGKPFGEQELYHLTRDYHGGHTACTCAGSQGRPTCKHQEALKVKLGLRDVIHPRCTRCGHGCYDQDPEHPNVWRCHICLTGGA
jgi:hypothetical protein